MSDKTAETAHAAVPPVVPARRRTVPWAAAVCAAFSLVQLVLVVPGSGLGWDETVYTSQVSGSVPAAFFSAPRARGVSFLAAPVAEWTASTAALRVWLAVLSGAGLYLALRAWRSLLPPPVLALAGGLFGTLWVSLYYGPQVMPNLWSAYGGLAAVGCFLRAARDRTDRSAPLGLALAVTVTGLMRPPDAVWLVLPLGVLSAAVPGARRPLVWAALATGAVLGCGEWVVEAYVRYGGLAERLHRASAIQGGTGWNFAVDDQIRALDGRTLCRPCDIPWHHRATSAWWFALPVLAAGGLLATGDRPPPHGGRGRPGQGSLPQRRFGLRRQAAGDTPAARDRPGTPDHRPPGRTPLPQQGRSGGWFGPPRTGAGDVEGAGAAAREQGRERERDRGRGRERERDRGRGRERDRGRGVGPAAVLVASSLAVPYLFLIGYAAPRFLLPSYALLAPPVASCLWALLTARAGLARPLLTTVVAAALCGHVAIQLSTALTDVRANRAMRGAYDAVATRLHTAGLRPPCVLSGDHAVPVAFYTGCASRQVGGPDGSITPAGLAAAARTGAVAVLVPRHGRPPAYARAWRVVPLPDSAAFPGYHGYVAPPPRGRPGP
ncbi:hypothetical protein [Actinacidiphila sp. ITFR-21]|uniref:hypothetical protein n=1 Tax=Actinacidiphila sp. ITFR-21 TaxID=3075199 RepID=UPI00288B0AD5|nr:hypothetical protein [Streptomyces sp. ITFR-21]WNI16272.1 hypothetical protein RLT57_12530 [Streptomyces sp. ITFR-21]